MSSTETSIGLVPSHRRPESRAAQGPIVIEAKHLRKSFSVPTHRIDSFKERAVHPFTRLAYRELRALKDVSFEVRRGEFFGIVGRNGSGKSTLLKLLASIYRADGGTIRMAGRVAPFIELGVGFNVDLSARENVELNGVMMGMTRRQARRRLAEVLDFAELREFEDLKLKNYSSGMLVRLAFSLMIQSEADILLIDEVLAVGDAAFQQKCADVFTEMRDGDRTVILVTHDMGSVDRYCHRAMLLEQGEQGLTGDPEEVGREYLRINFRKHRVSGAGDRQGFPDLHARVVQAHLEDSKGQPIENVALGEPIRIDITLEARIELPDPQINLTFSDSDGNLLFDCPPELGAGLDAGIGAGEQLSLRGVIDNPLAPGRYGVGCWVARGREAGEIALQALHVLDFVVYGTAISLAKATLAGDIVATREEGS
jgi:ABC-2 type transport system ATP-binding protein